MLQIKPDQISHCIWSRATFGYIVNRHNLLIIRETTKNETFVKETRCFCPNPCLRSRICNYLYQRIKKSLNKSICLFVAVFTCHVCQQKFLKKSLLAEHHTVHTSEQLAFQCPWEDCTHTYLHLRNLNAHVNCHHQGSRFPCLLDHCGKTFATNVSHRAVLLSSQCLISFDSFVCIKRLDCS